MATQEETIEFLKNFLFEMAMRIATLEQILLEKELVAEDELRVTEEKIKKEAQSILNND